MKGWSAKDIVAILGVSERTAYRYKARGEAFIESKIAKNNINLNSTANFKTTDNTNKIIPANTSHNKQQNDTDKLIAVMTKLTATIEELTVKIDSLEKILNKTLSSKNTVTTDASYDILLPTDTANSDNPNYNTTDTTDNYTNSISAKADNFTDSFTAKTDIKADSCQYKGGIIGGFDSTKTMIQVQEIESKKEKTNKKEKRSRVGSKTYNIFPEIREEIFDFFVQRGFSCVEQWVELTQEFMQHRCELKKAYTSFKKLADSRFFPNLLELSQGDIVQAQALVKNAIAENWHTVYTIKNPQSFNKKSKRDQEQEHYREGFKRFMGDIDIEGVMNGSITTEADFLYGDAAKDFLFKR